MSDHEAPPIPEDVATALAAERQRPGIDAMTRVRLRARISASLLAAPSSGTPPDAAPEAGSGGLLGKLRLVHPAVTGVVGLLLGAAGGAALQARLDVPAPLPERAPVVVAISGPRANEPAAPATVAPVASGTVSPAAAARPSATVEPVASAPSAPKLTAERALLDVAHGELANGHAASALDALGRHADRFPRGVYREEREALAIRSLRALGRSDEAERRLLAFKARYPNSLFLPTVEPRKATDSNSEAAKRRP
jgi:hypothetical protein